MQTLLALHGFSLNGALMRQQLGHLEMPGVKLLCPDGPHEAPAAAVERLYAVWHVPRQPAPHRSWYEPSADGRTYQGWDVARDQLAPMLERGRVGILGFSQGAILATAFAAMSERGLLPPIDYVILIAGRTPRADVFAPFLETPIRTPSLHIWGDNDAMARDTARELVDRFDAGTRQVVTWHGAHAIPTQGAAATAIEELVADGAARSAPAKRARR
jgi:predicted esterase